MKKKSFHDNLFKFKFVAVSSGITDQDSILLKKILTAVPQINYICLDVANGYTEHFVQYVRNTRAAFPDKTIIVNIYKLILLEYNFYLFLFIKIYVTKRLDNYKIIHGGFYNFYFYEKKGDFEPKFMFF